VSASSGFNITSTWADTFLRNAGGFSMLWHMSNVGGDGYISRMESSSPSELSIRCLAGASPGLYCQGTAKFGMTLSPYLAARGDLFPAAGEFFILNSIDYTNGLAFIGISLGATQPADLLDFDAWAVSLAPQAPPASAVTLNAGYLSAVGWSSGAAFSIKSLTAKKGASVTLA
jgi:hypothetical protein